MVMQANRVAGLGLARLTIRTLTRADGSTAPYVVRPLDVDASFVGSGGNAVVAYRGPSALDPSVEIMLIVTGLDSGSLNDKTGAMLQSFIVRTDVAPHDAQNKGLDAAVCGHCPLRPILAKHAGRKDKCYVKTFQSVRSTWAANHWRPAGPIGAVQALTAGRRIRRGSYGDPAMVPTWVWDALEGDRGDTGYTHQWAWASELAGLVMASVHTAEERDAAWALGFRTFRTLGSVDDLGPGEILCPASKEAGNRTTCARCGLCNGKRGDADRRKSIGIVIHN